MKPVALTILDRSQENLSIGDFVWVNNESEEDWLACIYEIQRNGKLLVKWYYLPYKFVDTTYVSQQKVIGISDKAWNSVKPTVGDVILDNNATPELIDFETIQDIETLGLWALDSYHRRLMFTRPPYDLDANELHDFKVEKELSIDQDSSKIS